MIKSEAQRDYYFVTMANEYPGYEGPMMWILFSKLPEDEICDKYPEDIESHRPYIYMNPELSAVVREYERNDAKHRMRQIRQHSMYEFEYGETEIYHPELLTGDLLPNYIAAESDQETAERIQSILQGLSDIQRSRFEKLYYDGMTVTEIAAEEGVDYNAVRKTVMQLKKKFSTKT